MRQDTASLQQNQDTCCYYGHEDQKVIGYCLFLGCQNAAPFCVKCVTADLSKDHQGHSEKYCLWFQKILPYIQKAIREHSQIEENYKDFQLQLIKCDKLIKNFLPHKHNELSLKLLDIAVKGQSINLKLIERKILLEQLKGSLQEQNHEHFRANLNLAKRLMDQQQKQTIFCQIIWYDDTIRWNPKYSSAFYQKGNSLYSLTKYEDAIKCYDEAQHYTTKKNMKTPQNVWMRQLNGNPIHHLPTIIKVQHDEAIRQDPENSYAFSNKGNLLQELQEYDYAIKCYDEAIKYDPQNLSFNYNKGQTLQKMNKYEEAIKCYDEVIKWNPQLSQAYYNKGNALLKLCKYEDAIKCYEASILCNPDDSSVYYNKGFALQKLHQYENAIKCYDKAIQCDPDDFSIYYNKGLSLYKLQKYEDTINCYDEIIKWDPQQSLAYYNKGNALIKLSKYEDAIKLQDEAIRYDSQYSAAYNNKALQKLQQYDIAIILYDEAIRFEPDDSSAYINKGNLLQILYKYENAIICYNEAIRCDPQDSSAYQKKGLALAELDKHEDAIKCYDEAIYCNSKLSQAYHYKGNSLQLELKLVI